MLDLMLHIDSYDKSICRTVSIGHVPESKEKNFMKIIYTVLSRVLSSRAELYPSWDAYYPMLGVQFVNFPFLSYCAASLAMLVSGSKKILKFHLRETCYKC